MNAPVRVTWTHVTKLEGGQRALRRGRSARRSLSRRVPDYLFRTTGSGHFGRSSKGSYELTCPMERAASASSTAI